MILEGDSRDYNILARAAKEADLLGSSHIRIELGVRLGGGIKTILNYSSSNATVIGVDPYGNIEYRSMDNLVERLDYDNQMKNSFYNQIGDYNPQQNFILINLEDTEFFSRYKDGVPTYQNEKAIQNSYSLVHFDGPHAVDCLKQEIDFFDSRTPIQGLWVFDDVKDYNHDEIDTYLKTIGFVVFEKGERKISYKRVANPARVYVINLKTRKDRREHLKTSVWHPYQLFEAYSVNSKRNIDCKMREDWIDPLENRPLTWGEIGCFLSHYNLWKKCVDLNVPFLILEDDVTQLKDLSIKKLDSFIELGYDFIYLCYKEMKTKKSIAKSKDIVEPTYPYWACSYYLTPQAAKKLINTPIYDNVIPVDEYLPLMQGYSVTKELNYLYRNYEKLKSCALVEPIYKPESRKNMGTDTETSNYITQEPLKEEVHVITIATDPSKASILKKSTNSNKINLTVLGVGEPSYDVSGKSGKQKMNFLQKYFDELPNERSIVMFVDGYDVFINDDIETIVERFKSFNCDLLFAAEKNCWPNAGLRHVHPACDTEYRYLNSGVFIGYSDFIKEKVLPCRKDYDPEIDDQEFFQKLYIDVSQHSKIDGTIKLDHECYIFQCLYDVDGTELEISRRRNIQDQLFNLKTRCFPCVVHGNGPSSTKDFFEYLAGELGYSNVTIQAPTKAPSVVNFVMPGPDEKVIIGPEMLLMDFMDVESCKALIDLAEKQGSWKPMSGDKFPAQEIRIRTLSKTLFDRMEKHIMTNITPIIEEYWKPLLMHGLRDAFVMKYTLDTQTKLGLHTDASLVTLSVKLNDDYEGAELVFPRQGVTNKLTPVGKAIVFPGQVTHGHRCDELISGVKYSLTIWSQRYKGDVNY